MTYIKMLFKSPAFWSALIAVISAIVMEYTNVPESVWIPITSLFAAIAAIFTGMEVSEGIGRSIARTLRQIDEEKKKAK